MQKPYPQARWPLLTGTLIGLIVATILWPPLSQAGPSLPPCDPPTATPTSKDKDKGAPKPVGA